MEKLVTLNISGEFDKGFVVQAEVRQDGGTTKNQANLAIAGASGKLPPHIELLEQYRHWQSLYKNLEEFFPSRLSKTGGWTNASDKDEAFAACRKAAKLLADTLNNWLQSPDFQSIVNLLLNHLQDSTSTRILLATENHWLRRLPWYEWNLLEHIPNAEIVLASPKFKQVKGSGNSGKKEKVKILVILGDNAGTDADEAVIQKLIPDAEICWLKEPQRRDLDAPLWEKQWDILFFAGHGKTESDGSIGKIKINSQDWLTIDEIKNHLKRAINNGLKLAIFNACDGLGIAYQLAEGEDLYLPQIIVMREILPIAIAPKFLQHFLKAYTQGLSLSAAIRDSRKRLQILESDVPCVSWLPVLCQNPAEIPLRWHDLVIPPNPYQGLSAFQEKDAALFFGRETFTKQLVKVVETEKLVAVIGASGSGKSSVVSAGLIPVWKAEATEILPRFVVKIRPGFPQSNPWENLAEELGKILPSLTEDRIKFLELVVNLEANEQELTKILTQIVQTKVEKSACKILLAIDQFEELYTLCPSDKCQSFLSALVYAVNHEAGWKIVLTLRADFLPQALDYEALGKILNQGGKELITAMTDEELIEAITLPVKNFEVEFSEQLINKIIQDYRKNSGHLPMLQFALEELWKQQNYGFIFLESYEKMGGLTKILGNYAENIYLKLGEEEKERSRQIMTQLVQPITQQNPGEVNRIVTRKIATIEDIGKENWQLVTKFADQRLVVTDEEKGASVELIHEVLITAWERLKNWIDRDWDFRRWQERLRDDLIKWEREKKDEDLLDGGLLKEAESWLEQRGKQISEKERGYIEKSQKKRDRQRQQLISGLTAGLVTVSLLAIGAVWQWRQAEITKSDVIVSSVYISLSQGKELAALMQSLRAGVLVQRLKAEPSIELVGALQKVVLEVRERNRLETHSSQVLSVSFSPDSKTLASGSADNTVKLWDVSTGKEIRTLQGHSSAVYSVSFSPDGKTLASGSNDKTIKLWDVTTGKEIRTLKGHGNMVLSVSFSPDGKTLASGSGDNTIKLWDVTTGKEIRTLKGHSNQVLSISFSHDGKTLASSSPDKTVKLWDVITGKEISTLQGSRVVSFSHDGKTLASGSDDNTIKLWDVATGKEISTLKGHSDGVLSISFSPDGKTLASGSDDKTIKLWDVSTGQEIRTFKEHSNQVWSVSFSPDGNTLASGSDDNTIKLWDVSTPTEINTLKGHGNLIFDISFSHDGKTLASGSADNTIKLWDVTTNKEIRTLKGHRNFVYSVSFSPDGKTLASGSWDNTIKLWDVTTGKEIRTLKGHGNMVLSVSFSPDGKTLASGSGDNTIKLWDVTTGKEIRTLQGSRVVSFSPDGKTLASGSDDKTIKLWDVTTGKEIRTLNGHNRLVTSISFSPDGKTLASGSDDNTIKLWDVATGKEIRTLKRHIKNVLSVSFSPDGKTLASSSEDKTVQVEDVTTPDSKILSIGGYRYEVWSVSFSPDGKTLAVGNEDKVDLWNWNFDDLLVRGCDKVRAYLHNPSANVSDSDRHLCDGISKD
ncbi:CHAT domain-containing protein [Microcoleus sp. CAWBG640]|uniref:nSTAND1 domain-containing NTPase n=1 Tax=Microcoleus sp. CAWBG640 TaxID=2841653 RepID=UPI00312B6B7E